MELIDKSALVAEIEKLKACNRKICAGNFDFLKKSYPKHYYSTEIYNDILSFIDTLEMKEVDLEKEIISTCRSYRIREFSGAELNKHDIEWVAKHFFELGLQAQKGKEKK